MYKLNKSNYFVKKKKMFHEDSKFCLKIINFIYFLVGGVNDVSVSGLCGKKTCFLFTSVSDIYLTKILVQK